MKFVSFEERCLEEEFNFYVPGCRKWVRLLLRRTLVRLSCCSANKKALNSLIYVEVTIDTLKANPSGRTSSFPLFSSHWPSIGQKYNFVLNDMVKLNGQGMEQDFRVGIALNIVCGIVKFLDNGLLLAYIRNPI